MAVEAIVREIFQEKYKEKTRAQLSPKGVDICSINRAQEDKMSSIQRGRQRTRHMMCHEKNISGSLWPTVPDDAEELNRRNLLDIY